MSETLGSGQDVAAAGGDSLIGMAMLGKTAAALALVLVVILVSAAVLRRWGLPNQRHGRHLRVIGSTAISNRERVVIVQVRDTWLVLGVGGGQVNKLHSLPAVEESESTDGDANVAVEPCDNFRSRLAMALKRSVSGNVAGGLNNSPELNRQEQS